MPKRGNNEGSVYKRKDGRWCAAVTTGFAPDTGKQLRAYYYADTRREVVALRDAAIKQVTAGAYVKPTKHTVGEWLETWLRDYVATSVRPKTWEGYESIVRVHLVPAIGSVDLRSLQTNQVQRLINEKKSSGLSSRTVELIHLTIKSALKQAMLEGLVTRNVIEHVRKPKKEEGRAIRVLSVEEMDALVVEALKHRLGYFFVTMLGTGLRVSEAIALEWTDIDLSKGTLMVLRSTASTRTPTSAKRINITQDPKSASGKRSIPLTDDVAHALKQWGKRQAQERLKMGSAYTESGRVYTSTIGTPLDIRGVARVLSGIASRAGLEHVNPHALRHTFATRLLERGVHPKVVQELLGHRDISLTLNTYSHVMPEIKQAAAAALSGMLKVASQQQKTLD